MEPYIIKLRMMSFKRNHFTHDSSEAKTGAAIERGSQPHSAEKPSKGRKAYRYAFLEFY